MAVDRASMDAGVARNAGGVCGLGVLPGCDFEKAGKGADVPSQGFGLHLLRQVGFDVAA